MKKSKPEKKARVLQSDDPIVNQVEDSFLSKDVSVDFAFEQDGPTPGDTDAKISNNTAESKDEDSQDKKDKPEFSSDELLIVFDEILFSGTYTEKFCIRDKLNFEFKMRTSGESSSVARRIDKSGFNMLATMEQHVALLNLSYSLVSFKGTDLTDMPAVPGPDADAKQNRYDYVNSLPGPIVAAMHYYLSKFDRKIQLALMEGEENF